MTTIPRDVNVSKVSTCPLSVCGMGCCVYSRARADRSQSPSINHPTHHTTPV